METDPTLKAAKGRRDKGKDIIRLVADVLGHKDVNTTITHYAAIDEEHRRRAAEVRPYD